MRGNRTGQGSPASDERGFTLMEMLVVLVLIGLIAAVALPQLTKIMGSSKHKAASIQMETLAGSLTAYQLDMGEYPTSEQGLQALWSAPADAPRWNGPYIRRENQLTDPWGKEFIYKSPGENAAFDLLTLGADGKVGGNGDDADISSID